MSDALRLLPYGRSAVLLELAGGAERAPEVVAVREAALAVSGVVEAVAGARTVLVEFDPDLIGAEALRAALLTMPVAPTAAAESGHVDLPVRYDGSDLADVAQLTGLSVPEVIARHSEARYTVRFCGFAPGFAYLDGLDPALHVARRASPRTDVPAGSVAIAGEFAGVYPRRSPGGWQLLGHTTTTLWDASARPPALLSPGTTVRFVPE